jgi:hypothetical protein
VTYTAEKIYSSVACQLQTEMNPFQVMPLAILLVANDMAVGHMISVASLGIVVGF